MVSFFTTPEDLQARIMHDVPAQLGKMGVEVTDALAKAEEVSDAEVLRQFEILPKLFRGRQVTVEFNVGNVRAAFPEDCAALHLEHGATVACQAAVGSGQTFYIYAVRDMALELLRIPAGSMVTARANTSFGTTTQIMWTDEGPFPETRAETGLIITEILNSTKPEEKQILAIPASRNEDD
jgi:hypothetical protein